MPVEWPFAQEVIRLGGTGTHKIAAEDGMRQQETARAILSDLNAQPGVILADEVGMGKTYVALAVVASVLLATRHSLQPVIVMMPPGLVEKWKREWEQFKFLCCTRPEALGWVRDEHPTTPTEFFKLLDDPLERRAHLLWMTTSCLHAGLSDPWIKLALIRLARSRTRLDDETKKRIYKWAASLVRLKSQHSLTPELVETLLQRDLPQWRSILVREGLLEKQADDPVPQQLIDCQDRLDWSPLIDILRGDTLPGRQGRASTRRLQAARGGFNEACRSVYEDWLRKVEWHASLLVLDEAHHAKNDGTRLARLFRSQETMALLAEDEEGSNRPQLWEKFDRMLFLTATPFQLGHQELIRMLRSFAAARWQGAAAPAHTREQFNASMTELEKRLDENRLAGRHLDRFWGRLNRETFAVENNRDDNSGAIMKWWECGSLDAADPIATEVQRAINECQRTKARAESDVAQPWSALRTWVIRHNRPTVLLQDSGKVTVPRRESRYGVAIQHDEARHHESIEGITIAGKDALPFLLAARAQGELAAGSTKARAFFAEGLCSSYEAFHHTREERGDVRDADDNEIECSNETRRKAMATQSIVPVSWYEAQIEQLIPSKSTPEEERFHHPKMKAVVDRVVQLWLAGEKVLVFCFYRETAKALRDHLKREIERTATTLVAKKLGRDPQRDAAEIANWFARISRRLADRDSPFHREIERVLRSTISLPEFSILADRTEQLAELLAAYVRSSSFVARYLPLEVPEVREALMEGERRPHIIHAGVTALSDALVKHADSSAMTMLHRIEEFLRFAKDEAERGLRRPVASEAEEMTSPLEKYLAAIANAPQHDEDDEEQRRYRQASVGEGTYRVLRTVRMVNGETPRETRERLMLAFNSPLFPEILVSSAVLSEGVDLHRFCRYVIHHDLCWNPSTLEQRTGRLDRIRCKAEIARQPIVVYEPFLAGSADEKMFRVVRDRERWFQIVMGQKFEFDEAASEQLANRVPLPDDLARELLFDLRRARVAP